MKRFKKVSLLLLSFIQLGCGLFAMEQKSQVFITNNSRQRARIDLGSDYYPDNIAIMPQPTTYSFKFWLGETLSFDRKNVGEKITVGNYLPGEWRIPGSSATIDMTQFDANKDIGLEIKWEPRSMLAGRFVGGFKIEGGYIDQKESERFDIGNKYCPLIQTFANNTRVALDKYLKEEALLKDDEDFPLIAAMVGYLISFFPSAYEKIAVSGDEIKELYPRNFLGLTQTVVPGLGVYYKEPDINEPRMKRWANYIEARLDNLMKSCIKNDQLRKFMSNIVQQIFDRARVNYGEELSISKTLVPIIRFKIKKMGKDKKKAIKDALAKAGIGFYKIERG